MAMPSDNRSFSDLLADALNQLTALVRSEIRLARAEMSAKLGRAAIGLAMMGAAAGLAIAALVVILMALAALLEAIGLPDGIALLLAGLIGAGAAAGTAYVGMQRLKAGELTPNRTIDQLQRDAVAAKEHVR